MAKRISMDAIIVLRNAGYEVKEVEQNRRGIPGAIEVTRNALWQRLEISGGCIENEQIEELLTLAKKF